jgi:hypothetical protein
VFLFVIFLHHGAEPGIEPCVSTTIQDANFGEAFTFEPGRLTDGRGIAGSASVEDDLEIAR